MSNQTSFGYWIRRRRKALDLTQADLARRVGCAEVTIQKIEADERRPSRQVAERLAEQLVIPPEERAAFLQSARAERGMEQLLPPSQGVPMEAVALPARIATAPGMIAPSVTALQQPPLPHPATPFIGRATELAEISVLLDDPACQLLTLTGPGGIGKTRLALGVAAERFGRYPHGVWFVNLAPLSAADGVVSAIVDTLKLSAVGVVDPQEALRNYLREKSLLLVLDNFEHVLEAADLVVDLLAAPGVQVFVTSRERLWLRAERVYEVGGLAFPVDAEGSDTDSFDAVRMFVACVHHAHPQYMLERAETPAVARICQLAAGMPLGIELAAAWAPTLPVATIAAELAVGLDLLETTMRDVPERHRSARAVFEHSWKLLTAEEQALFRQVAVFHGGFTFQAAQQVAGATLRTLARLVDTSLVRAERDGRYDVHELLRQFATEKLNADSGAEQRTHKRHSTFYLALLQRKEPELKGRQQLAALDELEREFENVRSAWEWALQRGLWERLRTASVALAFFMAVRSRQLEAIALLQRVIDSVAATQSTVAELALCQGLAAYALTAQSWYFGRLGQFDKQVSCLERSRAAVHQYGTLYEIANHCHLYAVSRPDPEEARALFERSLAIFREIGATWDVAFVIEGMGHFAFGRGWTLEARGLYEEALALHCANGERGTGRSNALLNLGRVAYTLGNYDEGRRLLQESLAMKQGIGSKIRIAECLEVLGEIASAQGQFAEAEARFQQELVLVRDLGYREQLSMSLSRLGAAVLAQKRLSESAELLAEALVIAERCGDQRASAYAHNSLGCKALRQGALDTARRHWRTSIDLVWPARDRTVMLIILNALLGLATLTAKEQDVERAVEVLALVQRAAGIDRRTETQAEQLLAELEAHLSPARFCAAHARGRALALDATVAAIRAAPVI